MSGLPLAACCWPKQATRSETEHAELLLADPVGRVDRLGFTEIGDRVGAVAQRFSDSRTSNPPCSQVLQNVPTAKVLVAPARLIADVAQGNRRTITTASLWKSRFAEALEITLRPFTTTR